MKPQERIGAVKFAAKAKYTQGQTVYATGPLGRYGLKTETGEPGTVLEVGDISKKWETRYRVRFKGGAEGWVDEALIDSSPQQFSEAKK